MARKAYNVEGTVSVGPYSHAVESGELVYLAGQIAIDMETGNLVEGDITDQTEQSFKNLFNVLNSVGLTPDDVVKVNVYLTDMGNINAMNSVYVKQFSSPYPARTTIGVRELPLGAQIEIEMIAKRG